MDDPYVILRVDVDADRAPQEPVIRQWFRPQRIHFEAWRLHGRLLLSHRSRGEEPLASCQGRKRANKRRTDDEQTWVGEISDSACAMKHESGVENVPPPPANECVANCIRGGSKYVIVAGDKVFQIANQNAAGLATLAGSKVKITGATMNRPRRPRLAKNHARGLSIPQMTTIIAKPTK